MTIRRQATIEETQVFISWVAPPYFARTDENSTALWNLLCEFKAKVCHENLTKLATNPHFRNRFQWLERPAKPLPREDRIILGGNFPSVHMSAAERQQINAENAEKAAHLRESQAAQTKKQLDA